MKPTAMQDLPLFPAGHFYIQRKDMTKKKTKPSSADLDHIVEPLRQLAVELSVLVPDPDNTVTHGASSISAIRRSLEKYGQDQPLVVQKDGMIVRKGNGRLEAARQMGWRWIAAVVVDEDDLEAVARSIADNRSAEFRDWDYSKLIDLVEQLRQSGQDPEDVGWTSEQLDQMLAQKDNAGDGGTSDTGDDGGAPASTQDDLEDASRVRIAHLFLDVDTFAEYTQITEELQKQYQTLSQTDTVLEVLRRAMGH